MYVGGRDANRKVVRAARTLRRSPRGFNVVDYGNNPVRRPGEREIWMVETDDDALSQWPLDNVPQGSILTFPIEGVPVGMLITEARKCLKQHGFV